MLGQGNLQQLSLAFGIASRLWLTVYQPEPETIRLKDSMVYAVSLTLSVQDRGRIDPDCFVTKHGIHGKTDRQTLRRIFKQDALYREKKLYHYLTNDQPSYLEIPKDPGLPMTPLLTVSYQDRNSSGWNVIRLSVLGYGFSSDSFDETSFFTEGLRPDLPDCQLQNPEYISDMYDRSALNAYIRKISSGASFTVEDLKVKTLPEDPDALSGNFRTIYLVTEKSGLRYHVYERLTEFSFYDDRPKDFSDLLASDRYAKMLRFKYEQYPGAKEHFFISADIPNKSNPAQIVASYINRQELLLAADEISAFLTYFDLEKTGYGASYYVYYDSPSTGRADCRLTNLGDIEGGIYDFADLPGKFLTRYLQFCLHYRRTDLYPEFTEEELRTEKESCRQDNSLLKGIYSAPHSELSISAVFELAEELGYQPEGTPDHFILTGKDRTGKRIQAEFSYDFIEETPDSYQPLCAYFLLNGEKQEYPARKAFCLGTSDLLDLIPDLR